jgi:hypothetical protein
MTSDDLPKPHGWKTDSLSQFINLAMHNVFATFDNKRREYLILRDINDIYQKIIDHLINTPNFLEAMLLLRAHSAYCAACRLAMSGQVPETFVILRSCLENALYALHINRKAESGEIWLNRHTNDESLKATRREFSYRNIICTLEETDKSLCSTARLLYERTIDFGAHPNERSLSSSLKVIKGDERVEYKQLYLSGDNLQLDHALKSTAQVGLTSLYLFYHIYKERFEIVGLTQKMERLRSFL